MRSQSFTKYSMLGLALTVGLLSFTPSAKADAALDSSVMSTLQHCQRISASCAQTTQTALGILIFPSVVKADLILGGAGGKGALVENGRITGYYDIGAASAGLQAGIDNASQVYVFRSPQALANLKQSQDWKASTSAGVTLVSTDANAKSVTGNVLAYVFSAKGLNAGLSLDVFDIWKSDTARPS